MNKFRILIEGKIEPDKHIDFDDVSDDRKHEDEVISLHTPHVIHTDHSSTLRSYTGSSTSLNRYLWEKKKNPAHISEYDEGESKKLTDILKTAPAAKEDFYVYTGVNPNKNKIEKGDLHIPAFTSASTKDFVASDFSSKYHTIEDHTDENGELTSQKVHHILKIHVKKGQQVGAYIAPHSIYEDEHEFLINKNHTIHLSGDYEDHPAKTIVGDKKTIFRIHHATITPHV